MRAVVRILSSILAHVALFVILSCTIVTVLVARRFRGILGIRTGRREAGKREMLLSGTFYNVNWFRSHILPLSATTALQRIYVVTDKPLFDVDKVTYVCPPVWSTRLFGRMLPRLLSIFWIALRYRPDYLMGYHIMPNAIMCLLASGLFGGESIYQMTGGPIQLIGGGNGSENALLVRLGRHSRCLEGMLFHAVRYFDCVVVRGESAKYFVARCRLSRRCVVITGSVDVDRFCPNGALRDIDIVYISRLVPCKGLEEFLHIVAEVVKKRPMLRVAILGDGPLWPDLVRTAAALEIESNLEFRGRVERVEQVLQRCRLFVLVSPSEGMSIAMMEAMATGVPVVVTDVGDLRDLVAPNRTGMLLDSAEPNGASMSIVAILGSEERRLSMSAAARTEAVARCSVKAVAHRWNTLLDAPEEVRLGDNLSVTSNGNSRLAS